MAKAGALKDVKEIGVIGSGSGLTFMNIDEIYLIKNPIFSIAIPICIFGI